MNTIGRPFGAALFHIQSKFSDAFALMTNNSLAIQISGSSRACFSRQWTLSFRMGYIICEL
jgi:hypothetical protein